MQQIVEFVMKSFGGSWGLGIPKRKTQGKCLNLTLFSLGNISRVVPPPLSDQILHPILIKCRIEQECITVGCVPPAH